MCERCGASLFAPSWDQGIRGRGRGLRARAHLILHSHSTTKRSTLKLTLTSHPRSSHPPYEKGTLPMATRRTFAPRKPFVSSPSPPLNCGPPLVLWSGAGPKVRKLHRTIGPQLVYVVSRTQPCGIYQESLRHHMRDHVYTLLAWSRSHFVVHLFIANICLLYNTHTHTHTHTNPPTLRAHRLRSWHVADPPCPLFSVRPLKGKGKGIVYVGARPIPVTSIVFEFNGNNRGNNGGIGTNATDDDNRYAYITRGGDHIDGSEGGIARFINHSFTTQGTNCEMVEYRDTPGRLFCRTSRAIVSGEELVRLHCTVVCNVNRIEMGGY